ncbi:uncharacterized protein J4E84_006730 [Alternaria hordeiaustralica]|uniref:uncharacterized protein n=1 Tax=Alternaria hordeiaustralica TaxID=1187925 RepID=UPI0020C4334C|nr:uncharacterized protein J4E84_006730 [Alternaria hordeiaustralica]KAI4683890.1 hypothetical protein J4E84_006730 [Alternaria hordeiaustralica]
MYDNMVAPAPTSSDSLNDQKVPGGLEHFRTLGPIQRQNLVMSNKAQLVDHLGNAIMSGNNATELPIALFEAVSEKHELVVDGKIAVPEGIDIKALNYLVSLVLALPTAPKVFQFQKYVVRDFKGQPMKDVEDTFKDLHLCCAADALGIGSFTQGIFNHFFSRINTKVPPTDVINIITAANNPTGNKLFKQMAYTMATKLNDGTFPDPEGFKQKYLTTNPRFSETIDRFLTNITETDARNAEYQKREAGRQQFAAHNAQHEAWKAAEKVRKKQREADEAARWAAAGVSYRKKVSQGKKNFTLLEVKWADKVAGKRVYPGTGN